MRTAPALLVALLAAAAAPLAAQADGKAEYDKYCEQCHGAEGDGLGIAARFLKPAPRDFTKGKYKVRSTTTGELPTDADLERVVKVGFPYTAMPAFPNLSDGEVAAVVDYIKTFSPDFEDPELAPTPIEIPSPPAYTEEGAARGREVYEATGCARCHGALGRGDGTSAPTLTDDWGQHIRAADLTMPWTFRGGGTRRDIFRTMSTGFNGTPMPGFHGALPPEDIWAIVDYIVSLSGNTTDQPYGNLVRSIGTAEELDLERAEELFAAAPTTWLPIVGQIIEPGRNFYPSAIAVGVQAVHNRKEIALRLVWHDMRAETSGSNGPNLDAPAWDEELAALGLAAAPASAGEEDFWGEAAAEEGEGADDFWGDDAVTEEGGADQDFWADDAVDAPGDDDAGDFWGDDAVASDEESDDFWGDDAGAAEDFWGDDEPDAVAPTTPETEFSDAVAVQFPLEAPQGIRLPYFLMGDAQNAVQLWFADLGRKVSELWIGRGSAALSLAEDEPPTMSASYDDGRWSVVFKQPRTSATGLTFQEGTFLPIAVSTWDAFNRERGNRRGLTPWYYIYLEPLERPSPVGPMLKAGLGVLGLEILVIGLVRLGRRRQG
jgi:mono/diheme cytochrome c family protein